MKGMKGGADSNSDNQITARELHTYVGESVVQQSGGSQVPELRGDAKKSSDLGSTVFGRAGVE